MQIKIESGNLVVSVSCLLERLTLEEKRELIQYLACDQQIMNEVAAQITDGFTSEGWHGPISCGASVEPVGGIEAARRLIAEKSSGIAAREIAALKREIMHEKELGQKGWEMYHAEIRRKF